MSLKSSDRPSRHFKKAGARRAWSGPGSPTAQSIVVIEDHPLLRSALVVLIDRQPDMRVVGEADSVAAALEIVKDRRPDLALLDLMLLGGGGIDLVKQIADLPNDPPPYMLIHSALDENLYAERALRAGACGYVMKREQPQTLLSAIRCVLAGGVYLSPRVELTLLKTMVGNRAEAKTPLERLSDRELQVLELLGQGKGMREIASGLYLSPKTVETHREKIKRKLGLKSSREVMRYAIHRFSAPSADA